MRLKKKVLRRGYNDHLDVNSLYSLVSNKRLFLFIVFEKKILYQQIFIKQNGLGAVHKLRRLGRGRGGQKLPI